MTKLQDLQYPIDYRIFGVLLACLPAHWSRAKLLASAEGTGSESTTMALSIDPLGQTGIALVSDELQDSVRELFLLNEKFKTNLRGIAYTYSRNENGRWLFNGDYNYGPD